MDSYGAYKIDPKNLVFWICVQSDEEKLRLQSDLNLMKTLRQVLSQFDYPANAADKVHIDFESQETVDRESNGNWFIHFK